MLLLESCLLMLQFNSKTVSSSQVGSPIGVVLECLPVYQQLENMLLFLGVCCLLNCCRLLLLGAVLHHCCLEISSEWHLLLFGFFHCVAVDVNGGIYKILPLVIFVFIYHVY